MQVSKWGNSLAIRLPAAVVRKMELKPGDEVEIRPMGPRMVELALSAEEEAERNRRLKALETIRELRNGLPRLPEGYKFNRDEIYDEDFRGHADTAQS